MPLAESRANQSPQPWQGIKVNSTQLGTKVHQTVNTYTVWRVLEQHTESLQESIYCWSFSGVRFSLTHRYSLCLSDRSQNTLQPSEQHWTFLESATNPSPMSRPGDTKNHVTSYTRWSHISIWSEGCMPTVWFNLIQTVWWQSKTSYVWWKRASNPAD